MNSKPRLSSRRAFLKTGATGAALLGAPLVVPARFLGKEAPSEKLTMGFIGTGNNGCNWMGRFMRDERVRVTAVCDVNREGPGYWGGSTRGREHARRMVDQHYRAKGCLATEDFREILGREDIDGIYIGTPDHWHAIIAVEAAKAKKDVYGQKPLSLTVAEGRAMSDAVRRHRIVWQTGSQQRSDRNFRKACEIVLNGGIGKLQTVRCGLPGGTPDYGKTAHLTETQPVPEGFNFDFWLGPAPEAEYCPARVGVNFRWVLDYSGGQITDWGGHHPDIAQWGMGRQFSGPVAIKNARGKFAKGPIYNTATEYEYECHYDDGVTLIITSHGIQVGDHRRGGVIFEGTDGWVWADRGRFEASSEKIAKAEFGEKAVRLYHSDNHVKNFIDCVFSRKTTVAPVEAAHRSITLAHLGNIALQTGRDLRWDPKTEQILDDPGASALLSREYRKPWTLDLES